MTVGVGFNIFSPYRRRVGPGISDERVVEERRIDRDLP